MSDIIEDPFYVYTNTGIAELLITPRDPVNSDNQYQTGQFWLSSVPGGSGNLFFLAGFIRGVPQWIALPGGGGGGGGIEWEFASGSVPMNPNTGYITNSALVVSFELPTSASVGSIIEVAGISSGGWTISTNSGQKIIYGTKSSSVNTDALTSAFATDSLRMLCVELNTTFSVISSQGNINIT